MTSPHAMFELSPRTVEAGVGDSVVVRVHVTNVTAPATVRWRSNRPAVAKLDTTVAAGEAAILRAVGVGTDTLRATVSVGSQFVEAWLVVTVSSRP